MHYPASELRTVRVLRRSVNKPALESSPRSKTWGLPSIGLPMLRTRAYTLSCMSGHTSMRRDVTFASEGANLEGWIYLPDFEPPWPLVVMAHGFSATRHMAADEYAVVLSAAGLPVLLYDHRGFGGSGGEPRRQINPWISAHD
jgi:alpha-beta hydrolase superfamily lysophospholipase